MTYFDEKKCFRNVFFSCKTVLMQLLYAKINLTGDTDKEKTL